MFRVLYTTAMFAAFGMFVGLLAFVFECFFWLKNGYMPGWCLADALGYTPETSLIGFNHMLKWYFDTRISGSIFFTSMAIFGVSIFGTVELEDR